jgi:hypothetical protein
VWWKDSERAHVLVEHANLQIIIDVPEEALAFNQCLDKCHMHAKCHMHI